MAEQKKRGFHALEERIHEMEEAAKRAGGAPGEEARGGQERREPPRDAPERPATKK